MENVWEYPRPPGVEPVALPVRIVFAGVVIADTRSAWRVLETSHPPSYYLPREAFSGCVLEQAAGESFCEWKGVAEYWSIRVGARLARRAAWAYAAPTPGYAAIAGHLAVYAGMMEACFVGEEQVTPQPGGFYGGWVTAGLKGPFKGGAGTMGW